MQDFELTVHITTEFLLPAKHPYKRRLKFNGHGRSFDVHLHQSDVIPETLKVISQNHVGAEEAYVIRDQPIQNRYYHARLRDDKNEPIVGSAVLHYDGVKGKMSWLRKRSKFHKYLGII